MFQQTSATIKVKRLSKRIRAVQGGTSASKTISILLYVIARAQSDTTPTVTSVVSESIPHLKRGAIRDFKNIMTEHRYWSEALWNSTDSTYTFETGSIIEFFSSDNGDKLRGARRDRLFINECNNVSFDAFEQLEVRTRDFIFLDWNPTSEFWFYTEVLNKRNDVDHILLTYLDNEALDASTRASIEQRRNRKGWWRVYGEGQLGEIEGKIYNGWEIVDEVQREARLVRYGLDFGYTLDPSAIVAVYKLNDAFLLDEVTFLKGLQNNQLADILKNEEQAIIVADCAEPKSIDELKLHGLAVIPCKKGKDSVRNGIGIVQQQRIYVTKRSVNLIHEYRNYLWMTDKDGHFIAPNEPEEGFDHTMDALRYALCSMLDTMPDHIHRQQEDRWHLVENRQEMNSTR